MKRLLVSAWVCLLVFGLTTFVSGQEKVQSSEYYPLKVGTTWTYKVMGQTISIKVAKHEKYNGVMCAVLETSAGGKVVATEHISVAKDGIYRHSMAGNKADPAVRFIKLPIKKGESWKIESKIGGQDLKVSYTAGEDEITVPAGKYKTITTQTNEFEAGGQKITAKIWYAKGVGMVKTVMELAGNTVTLELDKFEAGK
jgi:hypothetical protein